MRGEEWCAQAIAWLGHSVVAAVSVAGDGCVGGGGWRGVCQAGRRWCAWGRGGHS